MDNWDAQRLLEKYNAGIATEEERAWVESWYNRMPDQAGNLSQDQAAEDRRQSLAALDREYQSAGAVRYLSPGVRRYLPKAAAAVILLAVAGTLVYEISRKHASAPVPTVVAAKADIPPGADKAVLTLANGQQILLDDAGEGKLASQAGVTITKAAGGQIVYAVAATSEKPGSADAGYNTIATPRGGQYQVVLPDGSHVWLNAASSLQYPLSFSGKSRQVVLTGEACFDVAGDKVRPFLVRSACKGKTQVVEVLGTYFNVNAYEDEGDIRTTLIRGAVNVRQDGISGGHMLHPGQQALLRDEKMSVSEVDADAAVAWKEGYFVFDEEDLASIMRKVARWYDVEVIYNDDQLHNRRFNGTVSRYGQVSQVLKILELAQAAHFTLSGKKIIVSRP